MNRKITRNDTEALMNKTHKYLPDVCLRSTFIVEFPTESEDVFLELVDIIGECYFHHVGIFLYSDEDNQLLQIWRSCPFYSQAGAEGYLKAVTTGRKPEV